MVGFLVSALGGRQPGAGGGSVTPQYTGGRQPVGGSGMTPTDATGNPFLSLLSQTDPNARRLALMKMLGLGG